MNALVRSLEIIGIIAFALTGIFEARKKGMDLIGVYSVAMVTAFGGGSLRDIMLDRHPLFWIEHYEYAVLLLALSAASVAIAGMFRLRWMVTTVQALDAVGLGFFAASGTSIAYGMGCSVFVSSLLGVTTGVFGGVLRDIICNEVPAVFLRTELYATCAFLGTWCYLGVSGPAGEVAAVSTCIAATFTLRMLAIRFKIRLPI